MSEEKSRLKAMSKALEETSKHLMGFAKETLEPVSKRFAFEPPPSSGEVLGSPHVLILGNHSSGKSTFINHLVGQDVQKTGLAPTDDGFTLLTYAKDETKKDGNTVVGNPELPYGGLRDFGPNFVSHLRLKLIPVEVLQGITLIDSPGMIDAVGPDFERGYDFADAVRWFSERADLVVMFFDPDKPGTTGETMQIFADALRGIDHKLLVVLNKVDQFETVRDFARAYGSLCWNLARVITTKDLPHIYTTFIPVSERNPGIPVDDFAQDRAELIREIQRAPERRVENLVSTFDDYTRRLRLHTRVISHIVQKRRAGLRLALFRGVLLGLAAVVICWGGLQLEMATWLAWTLGAALLAASVGIVAFTRHRTTGRARDMVDDLDGIFEQLHHRELTLGRQSDALRATWKRAKPRTKKALGTLGLEEFHTVRSKRFKRLNRFIDGDVPDLRAKLHRRHLDFEGEKSGVSETDKSTAKPKKLSA